ncbi:MAG: AzlC family ABC transporter permease [Lachnospiraceae bacterium]
MNSLAQDKKHGKFDIGYATFGEGIKACLPTVLGYIGIGLAAGVVGRNSGLSTLQIALMSTLIYAGGSQFIICSMLLLSSPLQAIIMTTFLVNLRNFLMSLSASQYFKTYGILPNIGIGTLLTDESYTVLMGAVQRKKHMSLSWMNGLNLTAYLTWILATVVGAMLGGLIPDPYRLGLDYALVGMFAGLFILQVELPIKERTKQTLLIIGVVAVGTYLLMGIVSPAMAVLLATIAGCLTGVLTNDRN